MKKTPGGELEEKKGVTPEKEELQKGVDERVEKFRDLRHVTEDGEEDELAKLVRELDASDFGRMPADMKDMLSRLDDLSAASADKDFMEDVGRVMFDQMRYDLESLSAVKEKSLVKGIDLDMKRREAGADLGAADLADVVERYYELANSGIVHWTDMEKKAEFQERLDDFVADLIEEVKRAHKDMGLDEAKNS